MPHKLLTEKGTLGSIRELVFGIEDSLVSTVGVVVGIAAGTSDPKLVILSGVILVVVEALSMSAGAFVSSKSHREVIEQAIREEEWEIENEPEREREELRHMYAARGFSPDEIEILVRRITADKKLWLEEMMTKELRISTGEPEDAGKNAWVMFLSYVAGGVIPVVPFALLPISSATPVSVSLTIVALFSLGFWKGKVLDNDGIKSGLEMVAICASAALAGYVLGKVLGSAFGIDVN